MQSLSAWVRAPVADDLPAAPATRGLRVERISHRFALEALGVGALVAVVLLVFRTPPELLAPGAFKDDAVYLSLGRAIAEGRGYHSIYMPGAPLQVKYPPGLPLIYAILWSVFGTLRAVFVAAGTLSLAAASGAAATVWYIARKRLGLSPLIALPFVIGPFLFDSAIQYYTLPISESLYVLSWALILLIAFRVCDRSNAVPMRDAVVLGLTIAAAMLLRTQSVALFAGAVLAMLLVGRRREAFVTSIISATPIGVWQLWLSVARARGATLSMLPDERAYASFLPNGSLLGAARALALGAWINARGYLEIFTPYVSGWIAIGAALCLVVVILAGVGAWRMRRAAPVIPLTVAASGALALAWPWTQDRLLIPLLPFVGLMAATTLHAAAARLSRIGRIVAAGCLGALVVGVARRQSWLRTQADEASVAGRSPAVVSPRWVLPHNSRLILIESLWITKHARADDRVLAASPAGLFLQTGRPGLSSSPAESRLVTSAFSVPGHFLASAINDDHISLVLIEGPGDLNRDVGVLRRACPNAFHLDGQGIGGWPSFLRVVDTECIARAFP